MKETHMKVLQFLMLTLFVTSTALNAMNQKSPAKISAAIRIPNKTLPSSRPQTAINITSMPTDDPTYPQQLSTAVGIAAITRDKKTDDDASSSSDATANDSDQTPANQDLDKKEDLYEDLTHKADACGEGSFEQEYYLKKMKRAKGYSRKIQCKK